MIDLIWTWFELWHNKHIHLLDPFDFVKLCFILLLLVYTFFIKDIDLFHNGDQIKYSFV